MAVLDVNKIINATPEKRIINGYNKMKKKFTMESAEDFHEVYSNEPISVVLENSTLIFSEPYRGTSFYEDIMKPNTCCFSIIESEREKILDFMDSYGSKMNKDQSDIYSLLLEHVNLFLENTKNTQLYATYIKENIDDGIESRIIDSIQNSSDDSKEIDTLMESIDNPIIFFTYAPYVADKISTTVLNKLTSQFCEKVSISGEYNPGQWRTFVETVVCCNKLFQDSEYRKAVHQIGNRNTKCIFEYFMTKDLNKELNNLVEEKVSYNIHHLSTTSAINDIFLDIFESVNNLNNDKDIKEQIDVYTNIVYEETLNILVKEYQSCNDTNDTIRGYSLIKENVSIDDALNKINRLYQETSAVFEDDNTPDDDDDESEEDTDEEDMDNSDDGYDESGKKHKAPKAKNLANKVQFKAMDKEAKQKKKASIRAQKGQEVKNAVKSVAKLPENVITSVKDQIHKLDEKDDLRRRNYMTEPGFRKKALRNLKLAILYGSAASVKLSLVPVTMLCRHFSKNKDRRIRNELIRALGTEIKVCDEKINDANAANDTKQKYHLMRIREQLDAEMVRVKTNSKYI